MNMKKILTFALGFALIAPVALAATTMVNYTTKSGDTINGQQIVAGQRIKVYQTVVPPVVVPPVVVPPTTGSEVRLTAYTTGYGWPDNTPAGNAISNGVIHTGAGGTGTFADPITLAVGHSISNGQDTLDYPAGTKFYVVNLRKYFIVEDTCGDGNSPQNGPCHTGYQGHVWLDLWVGGQNLSSTGTNNCEEAITDMHLVIKNPASNYAIVPGAVYNGTCATQYGDTILTQ